MKRNTTAALLGALAIGAGIGIIGFGNAAMANRTVGIETGNMASIDVFSLIDRGLSTDEMELERSNFETQTSASLDQVQQQLAAVQSQLSTMTADDPNAQGAYQQYQQLQNQAQLLSQQASAGYQTLIAQQISRAYTEIYAAANEIAAEGGYAFVFATRSDGELLQTDTITGITQEILARPLVTPPSATDLTEQVRIRLAYPEQVVEDLTGEAPVEMDMTEPDTASGDTPESEE
jgi:Skp family chaperone for outer membrane proteins